MCGEGTTEEVRDIRDRWGSGRGRFENPSGEKEQGREEIRKEEGRVIVGKGEQTLSPMVGYRVILGNTVREGGISTVKEHSAESVTRTLRGFARIQRR